MSNSMFKICILLFTACILVIIHGVHGIHTLHNYRCQELKATLKIEGFNGSKESIKDILEKYSDSIDCYKIVKENDNSYAVTYKYNNGDNTEYEIEGLK